MLSKIEAAKNGKKGLYIWFLGQAGFLFQSPTYRVVVDPYLTGKLESEVTEGRAKLSSRAYPPPITTDELTGVDLICVSHDHGDHLDPETLGPMSAVNPQSKIIGPMFCKDKLQSIGFDEDQVLSAPAQQWYEVCKGLKVYPIPAAHYDLATDNGQPKFLGFVIDIEGIRVYHSGDTILYPGMKNLLLKLAPIDVACVTINGRHGFREEEHFIGNMTYQEAADLVGTLGVRLAIPMHHDLMRFNSEHPANFVRYLTDRWPDTAYRVLQAGRGHYYFPEG